jgi:hypothetical protein
MISFLLMNCSQVRKDEVSLPKIKVNLKLLIVPEQRNNFQSGYAILAEVKNDKNYDLAFQTPTMYIEKQINGKWEEIQEDNQSYTKNKISKLPFERNDFDSFRNIDKGDVFSKKILTQIGLPFNSANSLDISSHLVYFSFIKADSTVKFSRSLDEYLNIKNDFFRRNVSGGDYRVIFKQRKGVEMKEIINFTGSKGEKKIIQFPLNLGEYKVIDVKNVICDTLYFHIYPSTI